MTIKPNKFTQLRAAARKAGLKCLDTEWRGTHEHYHLRCAHGHEFARTCNALSNKGTICPECRASARLARIQTIAVQRGGRCLETRYLGKNARYRFVCAEGHQWSTLPNSIVNAGTWCPRCATQQHKLNRLLDNGLNRLQATAHARGGVCLTPDYDGMRAQYVFRCAKGHEWKSTGNQVVHYLAWCLLCANMARIHAPMPRHLPKPTQKPSVTLQKNRPKASTAKSKSKRQHDPLALRRSLGLNQCDFWGALGVTQSGGCRYEKGRKMPQPVATLLELVYVKKFIPQQVDVGDMRLLRYLKQDKPDLYATLSKAAGRASA